MLAEAHGDLQSQVLPFLEISAKMGVNCTVSPAFMLCLHPPPVDLTWRGLCLLNRKRWSRRHFTRLLA